MNQPNVLFIMTDQQRFDTIAALGNKDIYTPNYDRLVKRGVTFTNAYTTCPVCVPARYTIRTGCEPPKLRIFSNARSKPVAGQGEHMTDRCGDYLPTVMSSLGYRTFGIGKFHTQPWDEDLGYDIHLHSEELYGSPRQRQRDAYASWIANEHPAFDYIEALMGERTEMYYMPQVSPLPAELTVENWAAERAIDQLKIQDDRPFFGFVSFIGPHPPFAPPVPYNRIYNPDRMPNPIRCDPAIDSADEQITWMNQIIWAEDINDTHARVLKARYYGEITYIDSCLGKILDALESRPDADNTLVCFFADHGDHLGDHNAWQKESFFEASCHIPFLLSWPSKLTQNIVNNELVVLTDLFGVATGAAGEAQIRDGHHLLGMLDGTAPSRAYITGMYGEPGNPLFKIMIRDKEYKYIFISNGGREQLFDVRSDPYESENLTQSKPDIVRSMKSRAVSACKVPGAADALEGGQLRTFPYQERPRGRIYQFDRSRGVEGFPRHPREVLGG